MVTYIRPQPLRVIPRVSVVVPCYNYGHYLPEAVGSALEQPGVEVDVLIVDDASTDGSADVAHALAESDVRVRVIAHEENAGHIATYNEGLASVDGDYLVLLSADDRLAPGALGRATALMENRPDIAFTYGYAPTFTDETPVPQHRFAWWSVWSGEEWFRRLCERGTNVVRNPEVVVRRSVMRELGGYDARLPHAADLHLWLRASLLGSVGRVNGDDQAFYRVHGDNMHLGFNSELLTDLCERRLAFDQVLAENAALLARHEDYAASARRAIARDALRRAAHAADLGGSLDGGSVEEFMAVAVETWPDARHSWRWRAIDRRRSRGASPLRRLSAKSVRDLRGKIVWRRWRRFGT
jgi:GT2 family glycosyltransferase